MKIYYAHTVCCAFPKGPIALLMAAAPCILWVFLSQTALFITKIKQFGSLCSFSARELWFLKNFVEMYGVWMHHRHINENFTHWGNRLQEKVNQETIDKSEFARSHSCTYRIVPILIRRRQKHSCSLSLFQFLNHWDKILTQLFRLVQVAKRRRSVYTFFKKRPQSVYSFNHQFLLKGTKIKKIWTRINIWVQ